MSVGRLVMLDLKVGVRGYVYPIYLLVALAYGLMVKAFPESYHSVVIPLFIFFEPGLVGFMFVGTSIFAEKKDGTIGALSVTPIEWRSYIFAKTLLMLVVSLIAATLIMLIGTGSLEGLSYVLIGTFLVSIVYTLLGIAISSKYYDLDDYFVAILGVMVLSLLPYAHYHGYLTNKIWKVLYAVPSYPGLYFFKAAFEEISTDILMRSGIGLIIWSVVAYYFARIRFYKYAVEGLR
ncbi:ABC transporter permease [Thermococcus argininiproducens]|uniref:ABC transporter permease n=1 Tax=Thermococcus argininiproducens TaxID=2866384 RepID=A0A9E7SBP4_9EURY|nr:ABC transporter permease [Thermococcus argininiproducens]USG99108.1 ABC transporter permease [Thermococcus argininiproducens]